VTWMHLCMPTYGVPRTEHLKSARSRLHKVKNFSSRPSWIRSRRPASGSRALAERGTHLVSSEGQGRGVDQNIKATTSSCPIVFWDLFLPSCRASIHRPSGLLHILFPWHFLCRESSLYSPSIHFFTAAAACSCPLPCSEAFTLFQAF
jgi:hypothetical protein